MECEDYETIVYENDFWKDDMKDTLERVKTFIQRKKLVLVGGMAIDIALRSKGKHLYKDNKLPDYDFYSAEHHKDAYDLGLILAKLYDGVSVINAFHVSTMRVRVNFQEAADISYIPQSIMDKLPTIVHMGFVVIHPHYQMIDQHRSLSMPFENPPFETVFARWKKDITRYTMLSDEFPISKESFPPEKSVDYIVKHSDLEGHCMSGYASLLYWIDQAKADGFTGELADCTFSDDGKAVNVSLPESAAFTMLADDVDAAMKTFSFGTTPEIKKFRPIIDKVNARTEISLDDYKYIIVDNYGDKRSAYKTNKYYVSNLQEVMCYLLTMGILYSDKFAINSYLVAKELLDFASDKYRTGNKYAKYLPTTDTYGCANNYAATAVSKQSVDVQFKKAQRTLFTPRNAYPDKKNPYIKPELYQFNPANEVLFQFDGTEI